MAFDIKIRNKEGEKKPTRYFSKKQEDQVAKSLGGNRNLNSGATPFQPGDVSIDSLMLIECKTKITSSESISIKKEWLDKNLKEALFSGKPYNVLAFNFGPDQKNYYILDENTFIDFLNYLKIKHKK